MTGATIAAVILATIVPVVVLYIIFTLNLYETGSFRWVSLCFLWGGFTVALAVVANTEIYNRGASYDTMVRFVAPVVEEILKALILIYLVRRGDFNFFVDGAIYGFAAGIGFAVFENYYYLFVINPAGELSVAIGRVFAANLMHAAASATVGIALGFARFQRFRGRLLFLVGGLAAAIIFHTGFNNLTQSQVSSTWLLIYAVSVGLGGTAFIAWNIKRGLAQQRIWIQESLSSYADRVTAEEAALVDKLDELHEILAPLVSEIFGEEVGILVEEFLIQQAQLGIKRNDLKKTTDPDERARFEKQIAEKQATMDELRRQIGPYHMIHVRGIMPHNLDVLGSTLQERTSQREWGSSSLFASLEKNVHHSESDSAVAPDQHG